MLFLGLLFSPSLLEGQQLFCSLLCPQRPEQGLALSRLLNTNWIHRTETLLRSVSSLCDTFLYRVLAASLREPE